MVEGFSFLTLCVQKGIFVAKSEFGVSMGNANESFNLEEGGEFIL